MTYTFCSILRSVMVMDAVGTSSTFQIVVYIGAMQAVQQVLEHPMNLAVCAKGNM